MITHRYIDWYLYVRLKMIELFTFQIQSFVCFQQLQWQLFYIYTDTYYCLCNEIVLFAKYKRSHVILWRDPYLNIVAYVIAPHVINHCMLFIKNVLDDRYLTQMVLGLAT